jgi:uncharacterized protein YlxP (DUF503 family)
MVIGICTVSFDIPMSSSLKDKRHALKPIIAHIRNNFNVSVAEVDHHDVWEMATIAVACVSTDNNYAHGLLMKVIQAIEHLRSDATLVDYHIEFL